MRERGTQVSNWKKRLVEKYRQPPTDEMIVLRGQRSVTVYGCQRILLYSPERICLRVGKKRAVILGKKLIFASLSNGSVTVVGVIAGVSFEKNELVEAGKV